MRPSYAISDASPIPSISKLKVEGVIAVYCAMSLALPLIFPIFKGFSYSIPLFAVIGMLIAGRVTVPPNAAPYLILVGAGIAMAPFNSLRGLQDCWLMLMGIGAFCFGYNYASFRWAHIFTAAVLLTFIAAAFAGKAGGFKFDPLHSVSSFESSTSFVFGVLAVWATLEKKWARTALSIALAFLTLKRIVVLAALIVVAIVLLPRRFTDRLLRPLPMLVINVLMIGFAFIYATGTLDLLISYYTGQTSNQLGEGRQQLYAAAVGEMMRNPVQYLFYGIGPGEIYDLIRFKSEFATSQQNLHNDSLKILVEYGGIVWTAFMVSLYWSKRFEVRVMMLYANILFLTDNALIYAFTIFPMSLALVKLGQNSAAEAPGNSSPAAAPSAAQVGQPAWRP